MENIRSRGVSFWGYLLITLGVGHGLINAARNIWRVDYVGLPILFVLIGIGILSLKNVARITLLILMGLLVLAGILTFSSSLSSIASLSKQGLGLAVLIAFIMRFIIGISAIIFFLNPSIKEQFKKGVS